MASLFEQVQKNLAQAAAPQSTMPQGGQTEAIQQLARGASGKAISGGPRVEDTAERMQLQQAGLAQKALAGEVALQQEQASQQQRAIQEEATLQNTQFDEQAIASKEKSQQQVQSLLNDFVRNQKSLDFNKEKAKMEQLGFHMRLGNDQYVDKLKAEGTKMRLDNEIAFNEALQNSMFSDELDLLKNDLSFRSALSADERQWKEEMANMDLATAQSLADISAMAANSQGYWGGVSGVVSGGTQVASQFIKPAKVQTTAEDTEEE